MLLVGDFHTHCGKKNQWESVKIICENSLIFNFNTVFLGCHNYVGSYDLAKKIEDTYNLAVIRGAELSTSAGHLLVLNIHEIPNEFISSSRKPLDIYLALDFTRKEGGRAVLAHPFMNGKWVSKKSVRRTLSIVDGAEIRNLRALLKDGVTEFSEVLKYPKLKLFSGSDVHPWEIGSTMNKDYFTTIESDWL